MATRINVFSRTKVITVILMELQRPLCIFDIEATGLSPERDRIVQLAITKITGKSPERTLDILCNPGMLMSDEVIAIHGITNEAVANLPGFEHHADEVFSFIRDCDLVGYNLLNFDVPMLWEELYRAGITWDLTNTRIIDVGNIFKKKEERSLEAAVMFYCDRVHSGAHRARGDVEATLEVFNAQRRRYEDVGLMDVDELHAYSKLERIPRVDLAGKIGIDKDGDYVYLLHSKRMVKVKDDLGFGEWMLKRDFPENTKMHLTRILDAITLDQFPMGALIFAPLTDEEKSGLPDKSDDCPF